MKISDKREVQQIAIKYSSKDFVKNFLVDDTTLPTGNPLSFRQNLLEGM